MNLLQYLLNPLIGDREHRAAFHATQQQYRDPSKCIEEAIRVFPPPSHEDKEKPVFILSAGWRSGSTLLQRLVCSDPDSKTLIWGEPYDLCGMIQKMAASLLPISKDWPREEYFADSHNLSDLGNQWIANLYPSLSRLQLSHRRFFEELYAKPAYEKGFTRWGLKEVRLGLFEANYLKWLFPDARFLFIHRDPAQAYASYHARHRLWYASWPDQPILTPGQFGKHWRRLASEFLDNNLGDAAMVIRYADLAGGSIDIAGLEHFLGQRVDRTILNNRVGSSVRGGGDTYISVISRWQIKRVTRGTARALGYQ